MIYETSNLDELIPNIYETGNNITYPDENNFDYKGIDTYMGKIVTIPPKVFDRINTNTVKLQMLISVFKDNEYSDDEIKNILKKTFNELCKITLDGYINNSKMDEKLIIDIISDFYGLLQRMMKYNLVIILDCELFDEIIKSGLNYFNLEEIDISKNITSFLTFDCHRTEE